MKKSFLVWVFLLMVLVGRGQIVSISAEYMRTYYPNRYGFISDYSTLGLHYEFKPARQSNNWGIGIITPLPRDQEERENKKWGIKRRSIYGGFDVSGNFRYNSRKWTELRAAVVFRYSRGYFLSYSYERSPGNMGSVFKKNAIEIKLIPAAIQFYAKRSKVYVSASPYIAGMFLFGKGTYRTPLTDRDWWGERIKVKENPVCFTLGASVACSYSLKRIRKR